MSEKDDPRAGQWGTLGWERVLHLEEDLLPAGVAGPHPHWRMREAALGGKDTGPTPGRGTADASQSGHLAALHVQNRGPVLTRRRQEVPAGSLSSTVGIAEKVARGHPVEVQHVPTST